jgi:signal transduction histidine kinase
MEQIHQKKRLQNSWANQIINKFFSSKSLKAYISYSNMKVRETISEPQQSPLVSPLIEKYLNKNPTLRNALMEALPGAKFILSKKGKFLYCFPTGDIKGFLTGLCTPPGKTVSEIFPDYVCQAILTNIKKTLSTLQLQNFEFVLPRDGMIYYYEAKINRLTDTEVIAVFNDITHIRKAEEEVKRQMNELDEKNRQLKKYIDSNLQLENFAYIASHDLREPLRTIRNFAGLLKNRYGDQLDETAINHINLIVSGAAQMNSLVEDLLTYSRVNTENHSIEEINTNELLSKVLNGLESYVEETKTEITINKLPTRFYANPTKMKQLFLNLITNAIKFRKPDTPCKINLSMKDYGDYWKINVQDNGIGIRKEFQKQIFMLFKKLHSSKEHPGTGLGLAICQKIIEQHEGDIWVESAPGEGATFSCTIKKNLQNQQG